MLPSANPLNPNEDFWAGAWVFDGNDPPNDLNAGVEFIDIPLNSDIDIAWSALLSPKPIWALILVALA